MNRAKLSWPAVGFGAQASLALVGAFLLLASVLACDAAAADPRKPLLMEGKKTLYQRVLTRPGAKAVAEPGAEAAAGADAIAPFSVFYVYGRERKPGQRAMVEIGPTANGKTIGWIDAAHTIDWKQALTLAFSNSAGRKPVIMFRERNDLLQIVEAPDPWKGAEPLYQAIDSGKLPDNFPVVSMEPKEYIDIKKQFYLLPILDHREVLAQGKFPGRVLKIASVTLSEKEVPTANPPPLPLPPIQQTESNAKALTGYRAAVVFLVDTTISMQPYIERTRQMLRAIYGKIEAAGLLGEISFGLVAYRNNTTAVPGLEYLTRVYVDPNRKLGGADFLSQIAGVTEAKVSSGRQAAEDGFAGINDSLSQIDWSRFDGRYLVMITDASSVEGDHPLSTTRFYSSGMQALLRNKGVALYVLHLMTKESVRDHRIAAQQYANLADFDGKASLYFPIEAGAVDRFGLAVDKLTNVLVDQVANAKKGIAADGSGGKAPLPPPAANEPADSAAQIERKAALVGYAMQLAYLGRTQATKAPPVFEAWLTDKDLERPAAQTMEVRVLMTRDQLSDLHQVLKSIIDTAQRAQNAPKDFFDDLVSVAAALRRAPTDAVQATRAGSGQANLAELGRVGEYLEGLPYKSGVLELNAERFLAWAMGEQQAFLGRLEEKIKVYEQFHANTDQWISFDGGPLTGDSVYPVPLSELP